MLSNDLTFCCPLLLLPSIFPSIKSLFHQSACSIKWPKCWSFSFSINPSNEYSGLISLGLTHLILHFSRPSVFFTTIQKHQFFGAQPSLWSNSHPYMTTGKMIALTRWTFVSKVLTLFFNMLSESVIALLPRSKCLLISWLQSLSAVILEPRNIKFACFHFFPFYLPWSDGTRCHDLSFLCCTLSQLLPWCTTH